jgi:hypothetical protein
LVKISKDIEEQKKGEEILVELYTYINKIECELENLAV